MLIAAASLKKPEAVTKQTEISNMKGKSRSYGKKPALSFLYDFSKAMQESARRDIFLFDLLS